MLKTIINFTEPSKEIFCKKFSADFESNLQVYNGLKNIYLEWSDDDKTKLIAAYHDPVIGVILKDYADKAIHEAYILEHARTVKDCR